MTSTEKFQLQLTYCTENKLPCFCSIRCYKCNRDIFEKITEETAKTTLITGCPHCNYSFVD